MTTPTTPATPTADLTHIAMLLDRSGSMASIRAATIEGFNAFVAEQRSAAGRATLTLAQFDDRYEEVYRDRDIADVPPLELEPRGTTALLDSIGRLISDTTATLERLPADERPSTVMIGIMTDGHENASREFSHAAIKALITERESVAGWTFLYLGANQDAIEVGASLGIDRDRSLTYDGAAAPSAYRAASAAISRTRTARAAGADLATARAAAAFSSDERAAAEDGQGGRSGAQGFRTRSGPARRVWAGGTTAVLAAVVLLAAAVGRVRRTSRPTRTLAADAHHPR